MRGGTSKGLIFKREDLPPVTLPAFGSKKPFVPPASSAWDSIFLQGMGDPDPKQIDGMGGTVSSNNKCVVVWKSDDPKADLEYIVGQVIVGKSTVDYKSNCGNMTSVVGPFAIDEGIIPAKDGRQTVRLLNRNTDTYICVPVPVKNGRFVEEGGCRIAGIDGTGSELKVTFVEPAGAKTGKLMPTGHAKDTLDIPGLGRIEATLLDVSNPTILVRASDIGLKATELPAEVDGSKAAAELLEKIRGTAACMMGFAKDLKDATLNSPAVPKVGFFATPVTFKDLEGREVKASDMDLSARVISVFKCHKACPLTAASVIAVAALLPGTIVSEALSIKPGQDFVRIGHPSGIMTMYPEIKKTGTGYDIPGVAVARTARRIMDGMLYIRN
jgi:2-methylaconitate cis-trans-isomerase PrpF